MNRADALALCERYPWLCCEDAEAARGRCYATSLLTAALAAEQKIKTTLARFDVRMDDFHEHWAIYLDDGGFFDPTAAQVDGKPEPFRFDYPAKFSAPRFYAAARLLTPALRAGVLDENRDDGGFFPLYERFERRRRWYRWISAAHVFGLAV